MEIRFTEVGDVRPPGVSFRDLVNDAAGLHGMAVTITSERERCVRFRLLDADTADHDKVIRALLTLDPDATVRTARAVFEGLADFEAQVKARVP